MDASYVPPSDFQANIIRFMKRNRVSVDDVPQYIRLVEQLRSVYVSNYRTGRGLWDQTQNRGLEGRDLLRLVQDPAGLLTKIKNPGGEIYRTEEKEFFIVARAICGSTSGAGTLGTIATQRNKKKVTKHLKTYTFD